MITVINWLQLKLICQSNKTMSIALTVNCVKREYGIQRVSSFPWAVPPKCARRVHAQSTPRSSSCSTSTWRRHSSTFDCVIGIQNTTVDWRLFYRSITYRLHLRRRCSHIQFLRLQWTVWPIACSVFGHASTLTLVVGGCSESNCSSEKWNLFPIQRQTKFLWIVIGIWWESRGYKISEFIIRIKHGLDLVRR